MHCRPFALIQHPELNPGPVDDFAHDAPQGIDLAHDVPLGHAADRRVTAHLSHGVAVRRQQARLRPHPRRRHGCLGPGMPRTNH